jgi:ADP-ribose pyrophosphatase YjhB (NUDIX family)
MDPRWLDWANSLRAVAQNGLTFARDPFDRERYEAVRRIAAEIAAAGSGEELTRIEGLFAGETGYATPKVDVRGVAFREEGLLFVRERSDGGWTLPGGFVDIGESPGASVEREVREESGFTVRAVKLLAVYDRRRHPHSPPHPDHIYKLFFLCDLTGGEPRPSSETTDAAFFREGEIPPLSLGRITPDQVARMFEHRSHPDWPADFD